jgi:hypothetical protein
VQVAADLFNWWTDVAVPLGAALIGGTAALIGAWRGAKWAAEEQRKYAGQIEADRRRDRLQSEAILQLDGILQQLEYRARAMEEQWTRTPSAISSNWYEPLTNHLNQFEIDSSSVSLRLKDDWVWSAIEGFDASGLLADVAAARDQRESRQDQESVDDARDVNRRVLQDTQDLRAELNKAI